MKFTVVAERSAGLFRGGERICNPLLIRDIFDPSLRTRTERRTWTGLEANNELAVRRFFADAVRENICDLRGFVIVTIKPEGDDIVSRHE